MDRLHLMSVYVAVVEAEGFAGGARKLQMSPPAVTRAVAALEERLGVKLLNRTTRYVRMTEAGQKYYEDAKRIIALADEADDAALGINAEPRGQLTVTASVLFGRLYRHAGHHRVFAPLSGSGSQRPVRGPGGQYAGGRRGRGDPHRRVARFVVPGAAGRFGKAGTVRIAGLSGRPTAFRKPRTICSSIESSWRAA